MVWLSKRPAACAHPLLLALVLLNAHSLARTSEGGEVKRLFNVTAEDTWYRRIRAISEQSPTSQVLAFNNTLKEQVMPVYNLIDKITRVVENRRKKNSEEACSLRHDATWVAAARTRLNKYQIPKIDETCLSLIEGELAIREGELDRGFRPKALADIRQARQALYDATARSTLNATLNGLGWTGSYLLSGFRESYFNQDCEAEYVFAYRVNNVWYLRHSVTNHPITEQRENWTRNFTHEYISRDLKALHLPHFDIRNESHVMNASVIMSSWAGRAVMGTVFSNYETDEEQALATAIQRGYVAIDLAEDSVTPSNIAILALPMVMSFVPVAFLADLDSLGMVVYSLLTDVFAAIPFLVKGIELVRSSSNSQIEVNAFYMGNESLAQIEINGAKCTGESKFGKFGWLFIVIALLMTCAGVLLEIFAARFMARRRNRAARAGADGYEPVTGPFGAAMLEQTGQGYLGGEFERAENAYMRTMENFGLVREPRGWTRWLPGRGVLRRRNEPAVGLRSAEQIFETGYETESVEYDIVSSRDTPPHTRRNDQ